MNKAIRNQLAETYKEFCELEGNMHIASEFAILKIQEIIEKAETKRILEVGLGIGSIAGSLLKVNPDLEYWGTEFNDFCLDALEKNLGSHYQRLKLFKSITDLPKEVKFDLMIIDAHDENLVHLSNKISQSGIIIIEGDREVQQNFLLSHFPRSLYVHCISLKKNRPESPFCSKSWQGGIKVIFVDPTTRDYFVWLQEKLRTKIKYQFPGRYFGNKMKKACS